MFAGIRRILGNIKVSQTDREITIEGIPTETMVRDIAKIWKTSRINANMFSRQSRNTLSFPLFFAPDVLYMLEEMTSQRSLTTSVRTLNKIKNQLIENSWLAQTYTDPEPRLDLSRLSALNYKPLDHQQRFLEAYSRNTNRYNLNGYLLAAAPGAGKTFVGLALAECLNADRIVVVCPKNATQRVWEDNIVKVFKKAQSYWISHLGKPYQGERIAVFHYEALPKALEMVEELRGERTCIILDECHNLNEITAQRTQNFIELCRQLNSQNIIWASGTPIKALGAEAIPLLRTIDPYFTTDAEQRFRKIFGRDGNRGVDILSHRLGLVSFKVEKKELNLDKPIINHLPVVIPNGKDFTLSTIRRDMQAFIEERFKYYKARKKDDQRFFDECQALHKDTLKSGAQKAAYQDYLQNLRDVIRSGDPRFVGEQIKACNSYELRHLIPSLPETHRKEFKDIRANIKYVHLKIQGEALGRVLGRKRIECHVAMVPHIDFRGICESTKKKTVVFTSFVEVLEACQNHLTAIGLNPVVVYGKTNADLNRHIAKFGTDEDLNPLVATYDSLSTAVPLVMADTMVMINVPFRAYIYEQAISRIHRIGADTQTVVYQAQLDTGNEPNISSRSADILAWSQDQVAAIMGFKTPFEVDVAVEDFHDPFQSVATLNALYAPYGISLEEEPVEATIARPAAFSAW